MPDNASCVSWTRDKMAATVIKGEAGHNVWKNNNNRNSNIFLKVKEVVGLVH